MTASAVDEGRNRSRRRYGSGFAEGTNHDGSRPTSSPTAMRRSAASVDSSDLRPRCRHSEAARPAAAALRRRVALVRADESLLLEPRQGLVDGAEREVALREADDLFVDGNAVRGIADAEDREEDDLFELAEHGLDLIDNVENMSVFFPTQAWTARYASWLVRQLGVSSGLRNWGLTPIT